MCVRRLLALATVCVVLGDGGAAFMNGKDDDDADDVNNAGRLILL